MEAAAAGAGLLLALPLLLLMLLLWRRRPAGRVPPPPGGRGASDAAAVSAVASDAPRADMCSVVDGDGDQTVMTTSYEEWSAVADDEEQIRTSKSPRGTVIHCPSPPHPVRRCTVPYCDRYRD